MSAEQQRSNSINPDLDWSQVRETVLMLNLAAAQVIYSMRDGDKSVDVLTDSFTSMADGIQAIEKAARSLPDASGVDSPDPCQLLSQCGEVSEKMNQAIVAFQFYDKLVQRLDHVVACITQLGHLVSDSSRLYSPDEWCRLQDTIRDRYTMKQERDLFDSMLSGGSIEYALAKMQELSEHSPEDDDIELF